MKLKKTKYKLAIITKKEKEKDHPKRMKENIIKKIHQHL
jgi:hypothetical protein